MCRWRVALPSLKSVDVTDARARYKEQLATALPDLHKHTEIANTTPQPFNLWGHSTSVRINDSVSTLYDISKFSPPHICRPGSYRPSSKKNSLSIAKRPPAMAGDLQVKTATNMLRQEGHCVAQPYSSHIRSFYCIWKSINHLLFSSLVWK